MASRKRPLVPVEREERRSATAKSATATRKRPASGDAAPGSDLSPRMVSVAVLPVGGAATQTTATKRATSDTAHVSPPRNSETRLSVRQCFGELRTALSEGWEIVQP